MRALVFTLVFCAGTALAQAPESKSGEPKASEQKPRAPLKLRLDEAGGSAPLITFTPREAEKKDPAAGLPSLGGRPSPTLERPISEVVPKDSTVPRE